MGYERVAGVGPTPCRIMIVGEGPGEVEFQSGVPFSGPSGAEQDRYLAQGHLKRRDIYITNLIKTRGNDNGNPTLEDIAIAEPELLHEIALCNPSFIIAVGAYSTRWFLGPTDLETVHGLPQRSNRQGISHITIIPVHHPAYGLRDADAKALVWWDYTQAAKIIHGDIQSTPYFDEYPEPIYVDAGPAELSGYLEAFHQGVIAADIEGPIEWEHRNRYWGFSISCHPGTGLVFRRRNPEFLESVDTLNRWIARHRDSTLILHNGIGLDIEVLRMMGTNFHLLPIWDTMIGQFFQRVEPQALKSAALRWCGMEMREYDEVIGEAALEKEIQYILDCSYRDWPKPEPRLVQSNDGTSRLYRPQPLHQRANAILNDYVKAEKEVSLSQRWKQVDAELRKQAEAELGPWPIATLDDVPIASAVEYSGRDPDATLRLYLRQRPNLEAIGVVERLQLDLDILPIFEEMQATGFIAGRDHFERLSSQMWDKMMIIGQGISVKYNEGLPFNPASAKQVSFLAASRHLKGAKRTKKGAISTSKKSMEHLRSTDDAMDMIFTWREHQKVKDSFADPILERIPEGKQRYPIRANIKVTRVSSDRISASDPNLTALPIGDPTDKDPPPGAYVREGFEAPLPGEVEGAPNGCYLGSADLSQVEMRVMADLSGDDLLCSLFREERDIHAETAIKIFHLNPERVWNTKKSEYDYPHVHKIRHRNPTKRAGFGVITGIQGPGLLDQLRQMGCEGWSVAKFADGTSDCIADWCTGGIIHEWFKVYPGVQTYLAACGDQCARGGYVREVGGFLRYLPGVWSPDRFTAGEARRQSHSHIIQGSAQYMLRLAMRWLKPRIEELRESTGLYLRWQLQIHDEIVFAFAKELLEPLRELVLEALTHHTLQLKVPVKASWSHGQKWSQLK